jgi:hypothetical protein
MNKSLNLLIGGDLRSDGHADEFVLYVINDPELSSSYLMVWTWKRMLYVEELHMA